MSASGLARFVRLKAPPEPKADLLPRAELSPGLIVSGVLDCEGAVHIRGTVRGRINADRLVIEIDGFVDGDVVAREVIVAGKLKGRIFAHTVTVDASADVNGRIFHHTVSVAKGAKFEGRMPWRPLNYFESLDQLPEVQA
jgi:cytoskeletal protein CcmA (bactofilin family)